MKYFLLLTFLWINALAALQPHTPPPIQPKLQASCRLNPKETIIAFDLDEVVLNGREANYAAWLKNHPQFAEYMGKTKEKYNLSDAHEIIDKTVSLYPEIQKEADEFKDIFIRAPQIPGTIQIIHQLKNNGHTIVAASNMTTSTYKSMVDNKILPPEFTKDFFFVATDPRNKKSDGKYFQKPAPEYYENLKKHIHEKFPNTYKNIIFTDDKLANAQGAHNAGITAIHFQNAEQFKQELKKLGVCIE